MTSTSKRPLLGITMGDPGGIGPEVCAKALCDPGIFTVCRPMIIGDAAVMANAVSFSNLNLAVNACRQVTDGRFVPGTLDVLDLGNLSMAELRHKTVTAAQGRASFEYIDRAIALALAGEIDGTVTGLTAPPLTKPVRAVPIPSPWLKPSSWQPSYHGNVDVLSPDI
jgi:4-hydroxy-L-threonine phosphate dehydrogenase PdxA